MPNSPTGFPVKTPFEESEDHGLSEAAPRQFSLTDPVREGCRIRGRKRQQSDSLWNEISWLQSNC